MKYILHQLLVLPSLVFMGPSVFIHNPWIESTVREIIDQDETRLYTHRGVTSYYAPN